MRIFGLTGGIASGKSEVARRLRARGVPVVDADALAREAVTPGTAAGDATLAAIAEAFGPSVIAPDGSLDRKRVADIVFKDAAERTKLNGIIHPRIGALTAMRTGELEARGEPLTCYEAALIVENGLADAFRPLVVVSAPVELQVKRAMARDAAREEDVRARIAAQVPLEEKARVADIVLDNDASLADLVARTDALIESLCKMLTIDPARYPLPGSAPEDGAAK